MVLLDVLHVLQATQAGDLAVRWNCKAGKCGSCSAEVNGKPRLMCMTRMSALDTSQPITVAPMKTFPVLRDLVTDVSFNFEMAKKVPAFKPAPRPADGKYRMMQEDIDRVQEFHKCIECFLCQNVCHVIRDHSENKAHFAGPRMFVRYAALEMHPLDTNDRRTLLKEKMGLGMCNITKCCTEVCPESIRITDNAIIPLKETGDRRVLRPPPLGLAKADRRGLGLEVSGSRTVRLRSRAERLIVVRRTRDAGGSRGCPPKRSSSPTTSARSTTSIASPRRWATWTGPRSRIRSGAMTAPLWFDSRSRRRVERYRTGSSTLPGA